MKPRSYIPVVFMALIMTACGQKPATTATTGSIRVECDESVFPVFQTIADDFQRTYPESEVTIVSVGAREGTVNFLQDSTRVLILARQLNAEEREFVSTHKIESQENKVALEGILVIAHRSNPLKELRVGELDSIFSGQISKWTFGKKSPIEVAIGGMNSSTNEVFRNMILKGRDFSESAIVFEQSKNLVKFISANPNGIGIVGSIWASGIEEDLRIFSLGTPGERPDSTQPFGHFYSPAQANVYRNYYPLSRPVYVYNRELYRNTLGYGFVAYVSSTQGQKLLLNNGLVPVTMPVRLVQTSSNQVN